MPLSDTYEVDPKRHNYKNNMAGWELMVEWSDKTQPNTQLAMKYMKKSYPIQVADYAEANGLAEHPAFIWWVSYTLNKCSNIISKVKSRYWKRSHKYGIDIQKLSIKYYNLTRSIVPTYGNGHGKKEKGEYVRYGMIGFGVEKRR